MGIFRPIGHNMGKIADSINRALGKTVLFVSANTAERKKLTLLLRASTKFSRHKDTIVRVVAVNRMASISRLRFKHIFAMDAFKGRDILLTGMKDMATNMVNVNGATNKTITSSSTVITGWPHMGEIE